MEITVAEYVLDFVSKTGVRHVFGLIGGTCGILIDRLGEFQKQDKLTYIPMLDERSASQAVEGYARAKGFGCLLVSSGPALTNTLTGVGGAYTNSIPLLVIAGQTDKKNIYRGYGKNRFHDIRQIGTQEFPHTLLMQHLTKYSVLVDEPENIRYELEKAYHIALHGRPGPVFIDIPKDVQGLRVNSDKLKGFDPREVTSQDNEEEGLLKGRELDEKISNLLDLIYRSRRPVILCGGGIRLSNTTEQVKNFAEWLRAPVISSWGGWDAFPHDHEAFIGTLGDYATRAGNFTVQNSDLVIALGSRLDPRQTTTRPDWFARGAKIVMVDASEGELNKFNNGPRRIDLPIRVDLGRFFGALNYAIERISAPDISEWYNWVQTEYKQCYPVASKEDFSLDKEFINPRAFLSILSDLIPKDAGITVDCGINHILAMTCIKIKDGQRAIADGGGGALGYSIPASIGLSYALGKKPVISIIGDGGANFTGSELATAVNHGLPIKVFILNNSELGLLVNTQDKSYGSRYVGSRVESNGYSPRNFIRMAESCGLDAVRISSLEEVEPAIKKALAQDDPALVEVMVQRRFPFAFVNYGDDLADMRLGKEYLPVQEMRRKMRYVDLLPQTLKREQDEK